MPPPARRFACVCGARKYKPLVCVRAHPVDAGKALTAASRERWSVRTERDDGQGGKKGKINTRAVNNVIATAVSSINKMICTYLVHKYVVKCIYLCIQDYMCRFPSSGLYIMPFVFLWRRLPTTKVTAHGPSVFFSSTKSQPQPIFERIRLRRETSKLSTPTGINMCSCNTAECIKYLPRYVRTTAPTPAPTQCICGRFFFVIILLLSPIHS